MYTFMAPLKPSSRFCKYFHKMKIPPSFGGNRYNHLKFRYIESMIFHKKRKTLMQVMYSSVMSAVQEHWGRCHLEKFQVDQKLIALKLTQPSVQIQTSYHIHANMQAGAWNTSLKFLVTFSNFRRVHFPLLLWIDERNNTFSAAQEIFWYKLFIKSLFSDVVSSIFILIDKFN